MRALCVCCMILSSFSSGSRGVGPRPPSSFLFIFSHLSSPKDSGLTPFLVFMLVFCSSCFSRENPALCFGFNSGSLGVCLGKDITRSGFVSTAIMATEEMGGDAVMERQDMVSHPEPGGTTQGVGFTISVWSSVDPDGDLSCRSCRLFQLRSLVYMECLLL